MKECAFETIRSQTEDHNANFQRMIKEIRFLKFSDVKGTRLNARGLVM